MVIECDKEIPEEGLNFLERLEGIQIVIVKKGEKIDENKNGIKSVNKSAYIALSGTSPVVNSKPTSSMNPTIEGNSTPNVTYRTHVQTYGWQGWKFNGSMSGTSGQAKRLEGIQIVLVPKNGKAPATRYQGITSVRTQAYIKK